jgi:hypothetical protein
MGLTEDADMLALIAAAPESSAKPRSTSVSTICSAASGSTARPDELKARLDALVGRNRW